MLSVWIGIYLNGYVPNLQVGGQVVSFMATHLGYEIPSPAILEKIGTAAGDEPPATTRRVAPLVANGWSHDPGKTRLKPVP